MTVPTASGKNRHVTSRLDRWSNFCGDAMAMVFFSKRSDIDVFVHTLPALLMQLFGLNHR